MSNNKNNKDNVKNDKQINSEHENLENKLNNDDFENNDFEEDNNENDNIEEDYELKFLQGKNKHKLEGKHSLNRDVLFTGKEEEQEEEYLHNTTEFSYNEEVSIETGSDLEFESLNHEEYINNILLEEDVYNLLSEKTNLDFSEKRRKPKREDFNNYYEMLQTNLKHKYTNCEIFVTLSYYFTNNIFNMYKLLYRKHATSIIHELRNKGYLDNLGSINFV